MSTKIHITLSHIDYERIAKVGQTLDGKPTYGDSNGWKYIHPVLVATIAGRVSTHINILHNEAGSAAASHTHVYEETHNPELRGALSNIRLRDRNVRRIAQNMLEDGNNVLFDYTQLSPNTTGTHPNHLVFRTTINRVPPVPEENLDALQYRSVTYNNSYRDRNRIFLTNSHPISNRDAFIYRNMGSINRSFVYNMNLPNSFRFRDLNGEFINNQAVLKNYSTTEPLIRIPSNINYVNNGVSFVRDLGFSSESILSFNIRRDRFLNEHLMTGGYVGLNSKYINRIPRADILSVTSSRLISYTFTGQTPSRVFDDYPRSANIFHGYTGTTTPVSYTVTLRDPTVISLVGVHTSVFSWSPLVKINVEGSENGSNWVALGEYLPSDVNGESPNHRLSGRRLHTIKEPGLYKFYRITVVGDNSTSRFYVRSIDLIRESEMPDLVSSRNFQGNVERNGILEEFRAPANNIISNGSNIYLTYNKEFYPSLYSMNMGDNGILKSWKLYGLREEFISSDPIWGEFNTNTDSYKLDENKNLVLEVGSASPLRMADVGVFVTKGKQYIEFLVENTIPSLQLLTFQVVSADGSVYSFRAINTNLSNIFHKTNNGLYTTRFDDTLSTTLGGSVAVVDEGFSGNSFNWPLNVRVGILMDFDNNTISRFHDGELIHRLKINSDEFRNTGIATARFAWLSNSWTAHDKQTVRIFSDENSLYTPNGAYPFCQYRRGISDVLLTRNKQRVEFKGALLPLDGRKSLSIRTDKVVDSIMYQWNSREGSELEYDPLGFVTTSNGEIIGSDTDILKEQITNVSRLEYTIRAHNFYSNNTSAYVSHNVNIGAVIDYQENIVHRLINGEYIGSFVVPDTVNLRLLNASVYVRQSMLSQKTNSYTISGSVVRDIFPTSNSGVFNTNNSGNLVRINDASYGDGFNTITSPDSNTVAVSMTSTTTAAISGHQNEVLLGKAIADGSRRFGYVNIRITRWVGNVVWEWQEIGIGAVRGDGTIYRVPILGTASNSVQVINNYPRTDLTNEINEIRREIIVNEGPTTSNPIIDAGEFNSYIIKSTDQRHILHGVRTNGTTVLLRDYSIKEDNNFRTSPYLEFPYSPTQFRGYVVTSGNQIINNVNFYNMKLRNRVSYKDNISDMASTNNETLLSAYVMLDKNNIISHTVPLDNGEFYIKFNELTRVSGYKLKSNSMYRMKKWQVYGVSASGDRVPLHTEDNWFTTDDPTTIIYSGTFQNNVIVSELIFDVIEVSSEYVTRETYENVIQVYNGSFFIQNKDGISRVLIEGDFAQLSSNNNARDIIISSNGEFLVIKTNNIEYYRRDEFTGVFSNRKSINVVHSSSDLFNNSTVKISKKAPWIMIFSATHAGIANGVFSVNMLTHEITNLFPEQTNVTAGFISEESNEGKFVILTERPSWGSNSEFSYEIVVNELGYVSVNSIQFDKTPSPLLINDILQEDNNNILALSGRLNNRSLNDGLKRGIIFHTRFSLDPSMSINNTEGLNFSYLPNTNSYDFRDEGIVFGPSSSTNNMVRVSNFWENSLGHIDTMFNFSNSSTNTDVSIILDIFPTDISNRPTIITDNNYNEAVVNINPNGSIYYDYDNINASRVTSAAGIIKNRERYVIFYTQETVDGLRKRGRIYVNGNKVIDHTFNTSTAATSGPEGDLVLLRGFRGFAFSATALNIIPIEEDIIEISDNIISAVLPSSGDEIESTIRTIDGELYNGVDSGVILHNNDLTPTTLLLRDVAFSAGRHDTGGVLRTFKSELGSARRGRGAMASNVNWRHIASHSLVDGDEVVFNLSDGWGSTVNSAIILGISIGQVIYVIVIDNTALRWVGRRINVTHDIVRDTLFETERYPENEHPERDFSDDWNVNSSITRKSPEVRFIPVFSTNTIKVMSGDRWLLDIHSQVDLSTNPVRGTLGTQHQHVGSDFMYIRQVRSPRMYNNNISIAGSGSANNSTIVYKVTDVIDHNTKQVEFGLTPAVGVHSSRTVIGLIIDDTKVFITVGDTRFQDIRTVEVHRHSVPNYSSSSTYTMPNTWGSSVNSQTTNLHTNNWIRSWENSIRFVANSVGNCVDVYNNSFFVMSIRGDFTVSENSTVRGMLGDLWSNSTAVMNVIDRNETIASLRVGQDIFTWNDQNTAMDFSIRDWHVGVNLELTLFPNNKIYNFTLPSYVNMIESTPIENYESVLTDTVDIAEINTEQDSVYNFVFDEDTSSYILANKFPISNSAKIAKISDSVSVFEDGGVLKIGDETGVSDLKYASTDEGDIVSCGSAFMTRSEGGTTYIFGPKTYELIIDSVETVPAGIVLRNDIPHQSNYNAIMYTTNKQEHSIIVEISNKTLGVSGDDNFFLTTNINTETGFDEGIVLVSGSRSAITKSIRIARGRVRHSDGRSYTDETIAPQTSTINVIGAGGVLIKNNPVSGIDVFVGTNLYYTIEDVSSLDDIIRYGSCSYRTHHNGDSIIFVGDNISLTNVELYTGNSSQQLEYTQEQLVVDNRVKLVYNDEVFIDESTAFSVSSISKFPNYSARHIVGYNEDKTFLSNGITSLSNISILNNYNRDNNKDDIESLNYTLVENTIDVDSGSNIVANVELPSTQTNISAQSTFVPIALADYREIEEGVLLDDRSWTDEDFNNNKNSLGNIGPFKTSQEGAEEFRHYRLEIHDVSDGTDLLRDFIWHNSEETPLNLAVFFRNKRTNQIYSFDDNNEVVSHGSSLTKEDVDNNNHYNWNSHTKIFSFSYEFYQFLPRGDYEIVVAANTETGTQQIPFELRASDTTTVISPNDWMNFEDMQRITSVLTAGTYTGGRLRLFFMRSNDYRYWFYNVDTDQWESFLDLDHRTIAERSTLIANVTAQRLTDWYEIGNRFPGQLYRTKVFMVLEATTHTHNVRMSTVTINCTSHEVWRKQVTNLTGTSPYQLTFGFDRNSGRLYLETYSHGRTDYKVVYQD